MLLALCPWLTFTSRLLVALRSDLHALVLFRNGDSPTCFGQAAVAIAPGLAAPGTPCAFEVNLTSGGVRVGVLSGTLAVKSQRA